MDEQYIPLPPYEMGIEHGYRFWKNGDVRTWDYFIADKANSSEPLDRMYFNGLMEGMKKYKREIENSKNNE